MTEPLVVAEGVCRRFGLGSTATEAVRRVSCAIQPGDRIALIGPSGSGKSTLLHLLGGLDCPTAGSLSWPGLGPREVLRPAKIADVFQGPSLLPPLSVVENVRLPLLLQGRSEREATMLAEAALARFGVAHLRNKLPEEISAGQAQRIAIARALASRPALLLGDEPTGQLDSISADEVITIVLNAVAELDAAAIVATHDPRVARRFSIVWEMDDGYLKTGVSCST
jgi:ABC-type lipoprotein export system ATPase subunit